MVSAVNPGEGCPSHKPQVSLLVPFEYPAKAPKPAPDPVTDKSATLPAVLHPGDNTTYKWKGAHLDSVKAITLRVAGIDVPFTLTPDKDTPDASITLGVPSELIKTTGTKLPTITLTDGRILRDAKVLVFNVTP